MRFKAGDRVKIKSLDWYNKNKDEEGDIIEAFFNKDRAKFCGTIQVIDGEGFYSKKGLILYCIEDADEMIGEEAIEGLAEDLTHEEKHVEKCTSSFISDLIEEQEKINEGMNKREQYGPTCSEMFETAKLHREKQSFTKAEIFGDVIFYPADSGARLELIRNKGYEFRDENGNVIEAEKIVLDKKKPKWPQSYEDCCKVLNYCYNPYSTKTTHREELIRKFQFLLMYRDAYWKIAGKWKLEYPFNTARYVITNSRGFVGKVLVYDAAKNYVLEFPTEEMRDAFYENFKKLIEDCKELL